MFISPWTLEGSLSSLNELTSHVPLVLKVKIEISKAMVLPTQLLGTYPRNPVCPIWGSKISRIIFFSFNKVIIYDCALIKHWVPSSSSDVILPFSKQNLLFIYLWPGFLTLSRLWYFLPWFTLQLLTQNWIPSSSALVSQHGRFLATWWLVSSALIASKMVLPMPLHPLWIVLCIIFDVCHHSGFSWMM